MDLEVPESPLNKSILEDLDFELRIPYSYYKSLKKKYLCPKKSSHKSTMKSLSLPKNKKNLLKRICFKE